jgi:DNA-directed RNA polymerase beta subunit
MTLGQLLECLIGKAHLEHGSYGDCTVFNKKTDYLCNEKEKVCICNTHAEDFRKIYDGVYYKPDQKYISWFKFYTFYYL